MTEEISCPVCKSPARLLYSLKPSYIKENLEKYFNTKIHENLGLIPYNMMRCSDCTLTFSFPLKEGTNEFYSWITGQEDYYPKDRWEYHKVIDILTNDPSSNVNLLDVGCGSGEFMAMLHGLSRIRSIGVDTTQSSVEECQAKNLEAYCMDLDTFLAQNPQYRNHFDYVVTFHCLEHIGNPLGFAKSMVNALKPGGSIFISTPYSPMSFEVDWFDPLNHPPHHMGRWNAKAYDELGRQLNFETRFLMPATFSPLKRAAVAFAYAKMGFVKSLSKLRLAPLILKYPVSFYKHVLKQLQREKVNGTAAAEVILVELRANGPS